MTHHDIIAAAAAAAAVGDMTLIIEDTILTSSQTILLCFDHQTSRERVQEKIVIETLFSIIMSVEDGWWLSHSVWEIIIRTCGLGVVSTHSSIRSTDKYILGRDEFTFTTFSILSTKNYSWNVEHCLMNHFPELNSWKMVKCPPWSWVWSFMFSWMISLSWARPVCCCVDYSFISGSKTSWYWLIPSPHHHLTIRHSLTNSFNDFLTINPLNICSLIQWLLVHFKNKIYVLWSWF